MMTHIHTIILILLFITICQSFWLSSQNSKNYNKSQSIELDKYSAITHCTIDQIKTWNCKLCKDAQQPINLSYFYNEKSSVLAFMGYLPSMQAIIIVWRGTVDITNWIEDFTYYQMDYPECRGCKVHLGFYTAYQTVQIQLMDALKKLMAVHPNADIISTGSSLGGALAVVCGLQVQLKTNKVRELHVFGCPRVGNSAYAQFLTNKIPTTLRVVHNRDIVPHVPLQSQNYHHFPNQILFDENMDSYQICDDYGEDAQCSDKYYPDYSIPDHVSYFYKPDLEDLCTI